MKAFAILLAWAALASPAGATDAPPRFGFKAFQLGSDINVLAANPRYECHVASAPGADLICGLKEGQKDSLAGAPLRSLFLFYHWGRLTSLTLQVDEKHFAQVADALGAKYGQPRVRSEWVKNLKDKPFENRVLTWQGNGDSLTVQRFAGRLDQSSVRFAADALIEDIEKHRAAVARDPRLDI